MLVLRCAVATLLLWPEVARPQNPPPDALFSAEQEPETADPDFARFANPAFPGPQPQVAPVERGPKVERAELAPYFASGRLAEARAAFDAGNWSRARALLEGAEETPPVRFLRALAAFRANDLAFASKEFEALADSYSALRDRCLVHAGWAYQGLSDWKNAERVYAPVSAASRMHPDARLGLAIARKNQKNWSGAIEAVQPFVDRPPPPWGRDVGAEALLALADVYAWKGDKKHETEALQKLWANHPISAQANRAEARLGELSRLSDELLVTRGDALIDAHRNAQGVTLISPLLERLRLPDPLACRASFAVGKGYRKLRNHPKAVAVLTPVVKRCKDPELRAKALNALGFSEVFAAPALAAGTYEQLAAEYPQHAFADDALFFAADAHLQRGETDPAVELLTELVDRYPAGEFAADALFRLFWIQRGLGHQDEALQFLEEIEGRFRTADDSYEQERAQFWRGKTSLSLGRTGEAVALWRALAIDHPATYYGLIARERVEALDAEEGKALAVEVAAARETQDPFPIHAGPLPNDPQFLSAIELLRLGFGELVPLEVLAIDRTNLPPDSVRLLVHLLAMAGEQRAAHGLARIWLHRDLTGRMTKENRALWELAYPRAFRELVETHAAAANDLDPDLLQALMREESALDPQALSWAGALGLCQLMPATAAEVAAKLRLKRPTTAALLQPDLNIRLGARYLSDILARAQGTKQLALASYNAGEGAVGRWRRENPVDDLDAWVEEIPLQETRGYVKRVLRSYNTYKLLYVPTELPRTVAPVKPRPGAPPKNG